MISLREGPMEAGAGLSADPDPGKGCHGAHPYQGVDPILTGGIPYDRTAVGDHQGEPGSEAGDPDLWKYPRRKACNVIPDQVGTSGDAARLYPECRETNLQAIRRITEQVCASMGAEGIIELHGGMPPVYNDREVTEGIVKAAGEILGEESVRFLEFPSRAQMILPFFLRGQKGTQFFLGTGGESEETRIGVHSGRNVFEEKSMAGWDGGACPIRVGYAERLLKKEFF